MITDQNHKDAFSKNMIKSCDLWSDLNHDVLFLVMMQLRVIDFLAFSRVCKSWRSLTLSNKNKFIVSRPPMTISISTDANENEPYLYLEDFEGRKLKTILPHFDYKECVGVSCGYLILMGEETNDFLLVNPITRHEFHVPFPGVHFYTNVMGVILVFSPSISAWVFVVINRFLYKIWFYIAGKQEWTCVSTPLRIYDLHVFKGKIYTLHSINRLSEVRLFPTPKVTLLEIKNSPKTGPHNTWLVSSGENLYMINRISGFPFKIQEINVSKMDWMSPEKIGEEFAFFLSTDHGVALIRMEPWIDLYSQYGKYYFPVKREKGRFFHTNMWCGVNLCSLMMKKTKTLTGSDKLKKLKKVLKLKNVLKNREKKGKKIDMDKKLEDIDKVIDAGGRGLNYDRKKRINPIDA
ncbi:unnamed protein product [Lactuca virosa]|uniref:F-box domain-containing protein n=1 Tax=Lactuca virosa TaxID=75947 RepID=A0AAU9PIX3_9ASTR|nr:unnamed protein product [Lactuca virosa]